MITQIVQTATLEVVEEQEIIPEPIRVIRKFNGSYQWVILASEAEMSPEEKREQYCSVFGIYE